MAGFGRLADLQDGLDISGASNVEPRRKPAAREKLASGRPASVTL
jgi:hypothetical protein